MSFPSSSACHVGYAIYLYIYIHTCILHTHLYFRSQYKMDLGATHVSTRELEKDEWGPWLEEYVNATDPETGAQYRKKRIYSDPAGIQVLTKLPSIDDYPGVVWCDVMWCGVVWCGVVWCGVVWCGEVRCGAAAARCSAVRCE